MRTGLDPLTLNYSRSSTLANNTTSKISNTTGNGLKPFPPFPSCKALHFLAISPEKLSHGKDTYQCPVYPQGPLVSSDQSNFIQGIYR